jgi:hypothetical protein
MPRFHDRSSEPFLHLLGRAAHNVMAAVTNVVTVAITPTPQAARRATAVLLLASMGALAAVALCSRLPSGVMIGLGMAGAVGLLIAGYAGTRLENVAYRGDD